MSAKHVLAIADPCYSGIVTRSSPTRIEAGMSRVAKVKWFKTMTKKCSRTLREGEGCPHQNDRRDRHRAGKRRKDSQYHHLTPIDSTSERKFSRCPANMHSMKG